MSKQKTVLRDKVIEAAKRVWKAFMAYGPVDDGRPQGDEFDTALMELRIVSKIAYRQATDERLALVNLVNAVDQSEGQLPPKVAEAVARIRKVIEASDIYCEVIDEK